MEKAKKYVVSFSGGKDSSAMLLKLIENNEPIDEIIYCDVGKEFPQMYEHIAKLEKYIGQNITVLKSDKDFDYYMFDHIKTKGKNIGQKGYSWAGIRQRWCTSKLKTDVIHKYIKEKYKNSDVIQYIGIACDETKRIKDDPKIKYPLVEYKMTEQDCLEYCYSKGFDWGGLYQIFNRVSCWCCPLQSLNELRKLRKHFPDLWQELLDMDKRTYRQFRADFSVEELEERFSKEEMG